jgi:hypothetical protein
MRTLAILSVLLFGCGDDTQATPDAAMPDARPSIDAPAPDAPMADASLQPSNVPDALVVPETGDIVILRAPAVGVQIYTCTAMTVDAGAGSSDGGSDDGGVPSQSYTWVFTAPSATLFDDSMQAIGQHYAGPTWELSADGSRVVGMVMAKATPDPSAIPWLLLRAVSTSQSGLLSRVRYIQRLSTVGGLAPASGCDPSSVGHTSGVDYRATYYFWGQP